MSDPASEIDVDGIAIVGMACRFPGARTPEEFFEHLLRGVESLGPVDATDLMDASYFGLNPREAEAMDPQQRVFLEVCAEALQRSGNEGERAGVVGVYAGAGYNRYFLERVLPHLEMGTAGVDAFRAMLSNEKDFLSTLVSYKLNLTGPSVSVQTACSTSLVAVVTACEALTGQLCDVALAGGVSFDYTPADAPVDRESAILSKDGRCRPFDASAQGTAVGSGAAVVVLKRLEDALADGDEVFAVIKGWAVNNDGSRKVGFTAPSVEGQADVIAEAHAAAGGSPDDIGFVEAHGTGTPLGDPIEVAALTKAFRIGTSRRGYCALGSVKSNIGHADAAAGVAGLIKATLATRHGTIPPTLHFDTPNPALELASSPFFVNSSPIPWTNASRVRRAGVSSFGMGGTNAHVVLEQAPVRASKPPQDPRPRALVLSAKTPTALDAAAARLADHLEADPKADLADVAYTLQAGRQRLAHRRALVARDPAEAVAALRGRGGRVWSASSAVSDCPVAFMFPGQGAQDVGMARALYEREPAFRAEVDRCAAILEPALGLDIRGVLYPPEADAEAAARRLAQTRLTQPALFVVEYALARLWMKWGVRPTAMIGHSVGEYVAACLAGVLSLEDALKLVAARGRLMQGLPAGAMLAVPLSEADVRDALPPGLSLAAVNAPSACVVSGPTELVEAWQADLEARGIEARRLVVSHAFHSAMMDPILGEFEDTVRSLVLRPPRLRYVSTLTGDWIGAEAATPEYWVRHLRETVRFGDGVAKLLSASPIALVEVGPGRALCSLASQQRPSKADGITIVPSLRHRGDERTDDAALQEALARLWLAGARAAWRDANGRPRVALLPSYPFERQAYWLDAPARDGRPAAARRKDDADLIYEHVWRREPLRPGGPGPTRWLVFANDDSFSDGVVRALRDEGHDVVVVRQGKEFRAVGESEFAIDPSQHAGYDLLSSALQARSWTPGRVAHLWLVPDEADDPRAHDIGFHSVVAIAQTFASPASRRPRSVTIVSRGLHDVIGTERISPAKATVLGVARILPQEIEGVACRLVDIDDAEDPRLPALVAAEVSSDELTDAVAYRGGRRWTQSIEPSRRRDGSEIPLPEGGVCLITGGLGKLGMELAKHLARTRKAKLVLTSRGGLPPRDAWDEWLASRPADDRTSRAIRGVREIEALGSSVLPLAADVADEASMREVIARAREALGPVQGAIHAAGALDDALVEIVKLDRAALERQMRPKAGGAKALDVALAGEPLEFLMATSSLACVLGGIGFAPYAAANAYLDAWARARSRDAPFPVTSVAWDAWRLDDPEERPADLSLSPQQGVACFDRILRLHGAPHIVVAAGDLEGRRSRWVERVQDPARGPAAASARHARPTLPSAFVAPQSPTELRLARVWEEVLGFEGLGIDDDFFDLGGHSLLAMQVATRVKEAFGVDTPVRTLFSSPTIRGLAAALETLASAAAPAEAIRPAPRDASIPLSFAQQRLWFLHEWDPDAPTYNLPFVYSFRGALDAPALERALNDVVRRHEALRTTFAARPSGPVQIVGTHEDAPLPVTDLRHLPPERRGGEAAAIAAEEALKPFDLVTGPVVRWRLVRVADDEHMLSVTFHHIAFDGWSQGIFVRELSALYADHRAGRAPTLPPLTLQYADFAAWERSWLEPSGTLARDLDHWRAALDGLKPLELPTDRPRPHVQTSRGGRVHTVIDAQVGEGLKAIGRRDGSSLFMLLLAGFKALLHRYSGQGDIAVGSPIAGRNRRDTEGIVGFFVNTLVLRTQLEGGLTFSQLVGRVRETCLGAYAHQDLPFERLVEELHPHRDMSRTPLFQVSFVLQNAHGDALDIGGCEVTLSTPDTRTSKFDLTVSMTETHAGIEAVFDYSEDLYDAATIERMARHYAALLAEAARRPDEPIGALPMLSPKEREEIIHSVNQTRRDYPRDMPIHRLFEAQVAAGGERVALRAGREVVTYAELDARADRIARVLRAEGVRRGALVGLCAERSPDAVAGILGILKAGGAYVPLDPTYPPERLSLMMEDAGASVVLAQPHLRDRIAAGRARVVDLDPKRDADAEVPQETTGEDVAYVMYTSGSTGRPKGVAIPHKGVARLVVGADFLDVRESDTFLLMAPLAFDASTLEIWGPLLNGATLAIAPPYSPNLEELREWIVESRATVLWLTAPLFHLVVDEGIEALRSVRLLFAGGDVLSTPHVLRAVSALPTCRIVNGYGPTESTTFATTFPVDAARAAQWPLSRPLPIGAPIANTRVFVLDARREVQPLGVPGELHIGGDGLAVCYHNRPDLTAERFVVAPWDPAERLYRTGDLARLLPDGNVEFLGRLDHQVKIRGFRIEPGEIEAALAQHPDVREVVVAPHEDVSRQKTLVAYVVPAGGEAPDAGALRAFLKARLPDHMVPSAFVTLPALPLTPNGKVDRRALPAPDGARASFRSTYVAPATPTEVLLAGVWADVLRLEKVGATDDFFELGGHSLLATQVLTRVRDAFGVDVPLRALFEAPTVAQLAQRVEAALLAQIEAEMAEGSRSG